MHLIGEPAQQAALSILPETDAKKQQVWKDSLLLPAVLTGVLPVAELTAFYGTGASRFLRQRKPDLAFLACSSAKYKLSAACTHHSDPLAGSAGFVNYRCVSCSCFNLAFASATLSPSLVR